VKWKLLTQCACEIMTIGVVGTLIFCATIGVFIAAAWFLNETAELIVSRLKS
jgi:hypothetical protein